ncbi:hypothetical protein [Burkholderia thailandensis]|uniref:hypothetical protein n=1 Tax=Burkholderia thailandensis TaxID=57975 RepID=UPI0012B62A00|nr:hypothetical protein [Burkholderia thailandensis]MBS2129964.1 hypothetical protein [Burkholderia thailandensis]MCS3398798.1 hypothetical protein [Burkholderia thailandensis]MCS6471191.1 hypothetical protein [Burkholderia thailandensis]MCS6478316.1 hypothetical protein [Burkholderia thailandensis]MCS6496152.1 hypothetical protein [Burkholderia thailandensis]
MERSRTRDGRNPLTAYPTRSLGKFLSFEMPGRYVQPKATIAKSDRDMRKTVMSIRCIVDIIEANDAGCFNVFNYAITEK